MSPHAFEQVNVAVDFSLFRVHSTQSERSIPKACKRRENVSNYRNPASRRISHSAPTQQSSTAMIEAWSQMYSKRGGESIDAR